MLETFQKVYPEAGKERILLPVESGYVHRCTEIARHAGLCGGGALGEHAVDP